MDRAGDKGGMRPANIFMTERLLKIMMLNMHGWFHKLFKSRASLLTQREQEAKVTSVSSVSTSTSLTSSSPGKTPSERPQPQSILNSPQRWARKYDVFVCHSLVHSDTEEAIRLVSFLETSPRSLRCFFWHRDTCPGGAVSTELYQAMQDSHIKVLLITPNFLADEWCKYMMHQALAEGPISNPVIPLVQNVLLSEYPQELRFLFYYDLNRNRDQGYDLVNKSLLKYLKDLVQNEKTLDCNMDSSSGLCGNAANKETV